MEPITIQWIVQTIAPIAGFVYAMWRYTTKSIPKMLEDSRQASDRQTAAFVVELKEQRTSHQKAEVELCNRFDHILTSQLSAEREQTNRVISRIPKAPFSVG